MRDDLVYVLGEWVWSRRLSREWKLLVSLGFFQEEEPL